MTLAPRNFIQEMLVKNSEDEVEQYLGNFTGDTLLSWHLLGGNENSFGVIENQQAFPIAALFGKHSVGKDTAIC